MSTISGLGGSNRSWDSGQQQTRKAEHEARMFAKVDSDGSGSVDATELAAMLQHGGQSSSDTDSAALLKKMDTDGNGSLSSEELSQGMRDLMPPPSSTMDFAQSRAAANDDGNGDMFAKLDTDGDGKLSRAEFEAGRAHHGTHGAGGPPPVQAGGSSSGISSASSSSSTSIDPLDTNQDGTVSQIERLAGELKELAQSGSSDNGNGSSGGLNSEIAALAQKLYDQISKNNWLQPGAQTSVSSVDVSG